MRRLLGNQPGRWKAAFTLVELLVVVSIIAMLAGILMPSLYRAKEQAYCTKDLTNLRLVQMAWMFYTDDHNGRTFTFQLGHHPQQWSYLLHRYTDNRWEPFLPFLGGDPLGMRDVPQKVVEDFMKTGNFDAQYMTGVFGRAVFPAYGYNEQGWTPLYDGGGAKPGKGLNVNKTFRPAQVLVFGTTVGMSTGSFEDYGWYRLTPYRQLTYPDPGSILWSGAPPLTQNSYGGLSPRWMGKANISFADGHCVTVDPASLTDVRVWDPQRK